MPCEAELFVALSRLNGWVSRHTAISARAPGSVGTRPRSLPLRERPATAGLPFARTRGMLLAIDVGNTNTVLGVYDRDHLVRHWRLATDADRTVVEHGVLLHSLFATAKIER